MRLRWCTKLACLEQTSRRIMCGRPPAQVLKDAVKSGAKLGAIFKEPTVTPSAVQVRYRWRQGGCWYLAYHWGRGGVTVM